VTNSINFQDSAQITIPAKTNWDLSEIMKNIYPGAFCEIQLFDYHFIGVVYSVSFTESIGTQYNYEITVRIMFPLNLMHSVSLGFFRKFAPMEQDRIWYALFGKPPGKNDLMLIQSVTDFIKNWLNLCSKVIFCVNRKDKSLFDWIDTNNIEIEDFADDFLSKHDSLHKLENKKVYIFTPAINLEGTLFNILQNILQDDEIALDCVWDSAAEKFKVRLIRVPMAPKELLEGVSEKNKFSIEKPSKISFSRDTSRKLYFALVQPIQLPEDFNEALWITNIRNIGHTPSFLSARTSFGVDRHSWTTIHKIIKADAADLKYASMRVQMKNMSEGFAMKGSVEEHGIQNLNNIINRGLYVVEIPSENIIGWCTDISYRLQQSGTALNAFTDYSIQFAFYKDESIINLLNEVYSGYFEGGSKK
jgi:hypothetical protein